MNYAEGALRLGVLYDLLGRFQHHDMRDATTLQFMRRYQVDDRQIRRVEATALVLLGQLIDIDAPEHEDDVRFLKWAVSLHEIGISVAHNSYHKHGSYILNFADMPGFSKKDQGRLALIVLGQRGKLEKLTALPQSDATWRLVFCLRLAAILHRSRDDHVVPDILVKYGVNGYQLELPGDWLAANPLSAAVLADETIAWQRIGSGLRVKRRAALSSSMANGQR
jgi:exopolyphosphatase/guanosine-5'-triphosphate,3'-diphosphate pyrophosphatase